MPEQHVTAILSGNYAWDMNGTTPVPFTRMYLDGVPYNILRQLELNGGCGLRLLHGFQTSGRLGVLRGCGLLRGVLRLPPLFGAKRGKGLLLGRLRGLRGDAIGVIIRWRSRGRRRWRILTGLKLAAKLGLACLAHGSLHLGRLLSGGTALALGTSDGQ